MAALSSLPAVFPGLGTSLLPALEDTAVVLTMSVFRFGYFMGGDGDSDMKVDLRNTAGFVRSQQAFVRAFLLPIKVRCIPPSWSA